MDRFGNDIWDILALMMGEDLFLDDLREAAVSLSGEGNGDVWLAVESGMPGGIFSRGSRHLLVEERIALQPGVEGFLIELSSIGLLSPYLMERFLDRLNDQEAGSVGVDEAKELFLSLLRSEMPAHAARTGLALCELGEKMMIQ